MKLNSKHLSIFAFILSLVVLSFGASRLFVGHHDWNSVVYANIARNHVRYGILQTKLAMVTNSGLTTPDKFTFFTHYPPLMPLLLSLSFIVFGISEVAARLVPILSSAVLVFYLVKIAQKYFNDTTAIFTAIFLIFSPMLIYFSKIPVHETVVLGFTGFTIFYYLKWYKSQKVRDFRFIILGLILSQLTSWSGFYLSALLPLHFILTNQKDIKKQKIKLLTIFATAFIIFALHNLHMGLTTSSQAHQTLWQVLAFRLNMGEQAAMYGITLSKFVINQLRFIAIYFTRIMALLSFAWLITFTINRVNKRSLRFNHSIIFLLFIFGFTHNIIFRNLAFIHDYMLIYALPFFALSAAVILENLYSKLKFKTETKVFIVGIFFILFATERLAYINALFAHGMDNSAPALGQAIKQISQPQDKILILSPQYMQFHDVFLIYFADRKVQPAEKLGTGYINKYDYVVIPKSHDYVLDEDKQTLNSYPFIDQAGALIYDIRKPL